MTKHRYKYWFLFAHNLINNMYMCLPGKLNQNAHITLRALEDWQQLNLSVKNSVKELKTFDLAVGGILQIFMARWPPLAFTHTQFFFQILISSQFDSCIFFKAVCVFEAAPVCRHEIFLHVYVHSSSCYASLCMHVTAACAYLAVWRGLSPSGRAGAERAIAMFVD